MRLRILCISNNGFLRFAWRIMLQWDEKPPWGASLNESKRGLQQSVFDLPPPTLPPAFYFLSFHTFFFSLQHWSLAGLWACLRSVTRQQLYSSGYQDNAVRFTLWFHEGLIDWDWEGGERDGEGEIVATAGGGLIRKRGGDGRTFQAPRMHAMFSHATRLALMRGSV